jgi:hypothetical protein
MTAARICAGKSLNFCFFMGGEMVGKMLRHFELLVTVWHGALVSSYREMTF